MDIQERGIPFITFTEKQGFVLSKEAEDFLRSLDDTKLGLISVVGKYRTGKSFFVNRVLLQRANEGFTVGPTINPCTKGLWLWTKTLEGENPEHEGLKVLLIDTEGFGGIDENVNHDSRIFLFSLLLSSFFIYNSVGNIDEQALNSLSLIINLAKDIQIKSHSTDMEKEDPANYFPSFLWVVRDFALKMVDSNGVAITPKDYLERALELQKGVSDIIESKNRIRRLFKHFFKDRECLTLVRPIENEKDLQNINSMQDNQLREEFVDQIRHARKKIFKRIKPKSINGKFLTGSMLIELCKAYILAMNTGNMPNIENAWTYLCKNESHKALQESMLELDKLVEERMNEKCLSTSDIKIKKKEISEAVLKIFKKKALGEEEEMKDFMNKLNLRIKDKFKEITQNNSSNWMSFYESFIQNKKEELEFKIKNDSYSNYYTFQQDLNTFQEAFEKEAPVSDHKATFISQTLLKLQKMGAENLIKSKELEQNKQVKMLEQKLSMAENDLQNKKKDLEEERNSFVAKLNAIEREKAMIKANETNLNEKVKEIKRDFEGQLRKNQDLVESLKENSNKHEKDFVEKFKVQEEKYNNFRVNAQQTINDLEKQNALLSQEMNFAKKEITNLQAKLENLDSENRRLKIEGVNHMNILEKTKQKINEMENIKNQEIGFLRGDAEKRLKDMGSELEKNKETLKKHSELQVEKTYLESQVSFFKSQLDENKRLHDALLMALQQGINSNDNENNNELVETNRYLSAAMEKMEIRCKILEEKAEKLKSFKKMVKNSSTMQCLHCSKHVPNAIFLQHVEACLSDLQNPHQNSSKPPSQTKFSNTSIQNISDLTISINQTMVKESSDNKPYTEYLIQVTLNNTKWTVARKYKNFCELHQGLYALFPNIKFPDSVSTVMNSSTDVNNIFNSKRPTVIEERRKALQQFLRDLSKIECVRNCKVFKNFLEVERGEQNNFNDTASVQDTQTGHRNKGNITSIASLNSQREFKNVYANMIEEKKHSSKPSISSNLMLPDEMPGKEINLKIDKKMLPPSPSSFLNSWNNERLLINPNNKENKNPRSKSVSDNKGLNLLAPAELINNPAQTLVNDEENDTDRIANIDVSNISSTLQADTQSFQEISNEKSILNLLKGENQQFAMMMSSKNGTNPFQNHNDRFIPKSKNSSHLDLYHSNQRPQSYYSKNIYAYNKEVIANQPNNNSYSSNYEKKKNEKGVKPQTLPNEKFKNIRLDTGNKETRTNVMRAQDRLSQLIPSSKNWETMTGRINEFSNSNGYK